LKKVFSICIIIVTVIVLFLTADCKKEMPAKLAVISTTPVTNITTITATSGGNITSDGGAVISANGVCWGTAANPTTSDSKTTDDAGTGQFVSEITGLAAGTTYHVRAYATNSVGTTYGSDMLFATLGQSPSSVTQPATNVMVSGATLNGTVNANYLSTTVTFEYGLTTIYGETVTAGQSPVTGNITTNVSADISGLTVGITYHFRIKAANSFGTTYGSDVTFTTADSGTVTDIDGNIYNTITIGTQVWMKENLKTTKYRNGDSIGTTTPATLDISLEITPKYQWAYGGNESNVVLYGRLYTWYAVTDSRDVCPTGWHVPTDAEWTILTDYLTNNGYGYGGSGSDIAKSMAATSGWTIYTTSGTVGNDQTSNNSSGFSAFPSGSHGSNGAFVNVDDNCLWWSSTETLATYAFFRYIIYINSDVFGNYCGNSTGLSVRCLRD
jgi:uncharacterized protein (TIGR02145 family)